MFIVLKQFKMEAISALGICLVQLNNNLDEAHNQFYTFFKWGASGHSKQ